MNRRNALKNMGMAMGYVVATPTVLSILQSCKREVELAWTPAFFSVEEAKMIEGLSELIIPKTGTPGAKDLNIPMFIDSYINEVSSIEDGEQAKIMAAATLKELGGADASTEEYDALLSKYLKANDEEIKGYNEDEKLVSEFMTQVRSMSIWGFKTSEYIGENVMAYESIPGGYIGCGSLDELTGGKAWSLG